MHKNNWHYRRYKDKQREIQKHAPTFLYQKQELPDKYKRLKLKLNKERHWYDGMIQKSNGRNKLRHQLKQTKIAYNDVLKHDNSENNIALLDVELTTPFICDCENCISNFGSPTVIDTTFLTSVEAIEALEEAELIDLKQNFEKWEYKY